MLTTDQPLPGLAPRVSIIIVNWNGLNHLATCLGSLAVQTLDRFEVILVDNGSTDGSVAFVRQEYPWVRLVELDRNTGFATGNNRGLDHALGDYIVTLNNDTRAEPDWLERLVEVAAAHPQAGMVGCRICTYTDPDIIDSLGIGICRDGMSRGHFRNRRWSSLRMEAVEDILLPSACAALYRRAMLLETGFFDDDFFAYAEDTDLGLRGRLAGWDAILATSAVVHHKYSQTSGSLSPFKVRLVERNHYWVATKNLPVRYLALLPLVTLARYFEQLLTVVRRRGTGNEFLAGGSVAAIGMATLRGLGEALIGMPRMLQKRRQVMHGRRIPMSEMTRLLRRYNVSFRELLDND